MRTEFSIDGMHCAACSMLIKDICSDFTSIRSCEVDVTSGTVVIEHDGTLDPGALTSEIEATGPYTVKSAR